MLSAKTKSCSGNTKIKFDDGKSLDSIPYNGNYGDRCPDCKVEEDGFHHPNCDIEKCPRCECQLISCDCLFAEDDD